MITPYKRPPLKEAVCEFRFELEEKNKNFDMEQLHKKVSSFYVTKKKSQIMQVEMKLNPDKDPKDEFIRTVIEFDEFLSDDKKSTVQIEGSRLSIHKLEPYISWPEFFKNISDVFNAYLSIVPVKSIQRIGLRYINQISLPLTEINFSDYFLLQPQFPQSLNKNKILSFSVGAIMEFGDGADNAKIQISENAPSEGNRNFLLDIDYFTSQTKLPTLENALKWVSNSHTNVETVFQDVLSDQAKELFNK